MKISRATWIAIAILIVWLILVWFIGSWMGLKSPAVWYLRGGLWLIGIAGFAGYLLLRPKDAGPKLEGASAEAAKEIDYNFNEAAKRIQAATGMKQLGGLPAVFLIGDTGAAKTTVVAKSGIEPQLLAGLAFQDYLVAPTRTVNLWYSRNTLFIDPAGSLIGDPGARKKLFKKFLPVQMNSVLAAKTPPTRTVVFTVDCETFMQQGGAEAMTAKARQFQTILAELSQELGSSFPVYVLFTKTDRIAYFKDFVENLTEQEAGEIFGVTLPVQMDQLGVYSEQQTRRVTDAFQQLYYSLADKRSIYLAREHNAGSLPNIYEFPREFAKLRSLLVQFLVDLCRPSQLGTSPFLRGFYFTGIRAVTINDLSPAAQMQSAEPDEFDSGATRMFNMRGRGAPAAAEVQESRSRKVPQWLFLTHLFPDVILADRAATAVGASNVKLNLARRVLLGAAAGLALLIAAWWTISFANNRSLINSALDAASGAPPTTLPSGQIAQLDSLRRLTTIKDTLATLKDYEENGVPTKLGGFLYAGNAIREPLRTTYYALFRRLLLAPTQETLVQICTKPDAYEARGYPYVYDSLKSYLITTKNHEKSTNEFLTPVLTNRWKKDQMVDGEREDLARQNFQFYADELPAENPYPRFVNPDGTAVQSARDYLLRFGQTERIYRAMLTDAGSGQKPIVFNTDYPGTADTVINAYRVDAPFRKASFSAFQKELEKPDKYFSGEEWVLGKLPPGSDKSKLVPELKARYERDFVKTWQDYLKATTVRVPYHSAPDAVAKLDKLSGAQSSLLEALCVASENTSVGVKEVSDAFQPVQFITPAGCSQKLVTQATGYMNQLIGLSGALKMVGPSVENAAPDVLTAARSSAQAAEGTASSLALNFTADPNDPKSPVQAKTAQLLKDPITSVPMLLAGGGTGAANGAAGGMCKSMAPLLAKYPFNARSTQDATLEEMNNFLKRPDGVFWGLVSNPPIKPYLIQAGDGFAAASGMDHTATGAFVAFATRASRMSHMFYKTDGAQNPNLTFTMQPVPSPGVDHVTLTINGQTLSTDVHGGAKAQTFNWPGDGTGATLKARFGGASSDFQVAQANGLWGAWRFIPEDQSNGTSQELQWAVKANGAPMTIGGQAVIVKFTLDPQSAQILRPRYMGQLGCVSTAVK